MNIEKEKCVHKGRRINSNKKRKKRKENNRRNSTDSNFAYDDCN